MGADKPPPRMHSAYWIRRMLPPAVITPSEPFLRECQLCGNVKECPVLHLSYPPEAGTFCCVVCDLCLTETLLGAK